jgi:hypothetical protein
MRCAVTWHVQNLLFHCTREGEQGINFVLESRTWPTLVTSQSLVDALHNDYGHFNQCVVDPLIPYVYQ